MKKIGYLRISTSEQRPDRQIDGLSEICDEFNIETLSAVSHARPVFEKVISRLERGDTLVVWDLDRAFRSTIDAILTAEDLRARGIGFQVATLMIDTETPAGEYTYTIMAATAQFERRNLIKRTKEGMAAARARGVRLGRPPKLTTEQVALAAYQLKHELSTPKALALEFGVSVWTVQRAVK